MIKLMAIPALTRVLISCWLDAEQSLKKVVEEKYHDSDEDIITHLFIGEIRDTVNDANEQKRFEKAFLEDLIMALPELKYNRALLNISSGIFAKIVRHPQQIESKSGGDLGFVLIRPNVTHHPFTTSKLLIDDDYRRGLLCQAKMRQRTGRWGLLSDNQKIRLSQHLSFTSILLYQYGDLERKKLMAFEW